jgi:hypothetical protein
MDFKSLIAKIESIDGKVTTPQAPKLPDPIRFDEDAEMRVLAGTSTVLNEAAIMEKKLTAAEKSKKEEVVKSMKKDKAGFKDRYGKRGEEVMHATATKIAKKKAESTENSSESLNEAPMDMNLVRAAQDGMSSVKKDAESDRNIDRPYGSRAADSDKEIAQTSTATSDTDSARNKAEFMLSDKVRSADDIDVHIMPLVYRRHRDLPDDEFDQVAEKLIAMAKSENFDDPSDKMFKAVGDAVVDPYKFLGIARPKKEDVESDRLRAKFLEMVESKKQESYHKKIKGKKAEEKMDEAKKSSKKKPDADNDGVPDWADKKPGEDDHAGKGKDKEETKGLSAKQKKLPAGLQKAIAAKKSKKTVKESIEPKLSFRDMIQLVKESGGQQQIDPVDQALFSWASRVARNKLGEGAKAEIYAGLVYERMGGRFEMYDVLSENRLDEDWRKKLGAAAMAGIMGLGAMGGASAADMPGKDIGSDKPVAQVNAYKSMLEVEREVQDLAKVDKQAAKSYEATKSYYNKLLGKAKSPEDMKEIDKEYTKSLQTIIKLSTNASPGGG